MLMQRESSCAHVPTQNEDYFLNRSLIATGDALHGFHVLEMKRIVGRVR
jgi:hypothetical protein